MFGVAKDYFLDLEEFVKGNMKSCPSKQQQQLYDQGYNINHSSLTILDKRPRQRSCLLCCLFPFLPSLATCNTAPDEVIAVAKAAVIENYKKKQEAQQKRLVASHDSEEQRAQRLSKNYGKEKKKKMVTFANKAQVFPVKSSREMARKEKAHIWWQKSDYEFFQETSRVLSQSMCEKGSDECLVASRETCIVDESQLTLQSNESSPESPECTTSESKETRSSEEDADNNNKWWRKFGHSRRGLEHTVSLGEGKIREVRTRYSIRVVLQEQVRQRMFTKKRKLIAGADEELKKIYIQNSDWARDLALAAGASDAFAVNNSFGDNWSESRKFFLLCIENQTLAASIGGKGKNSSPSLFEHLMTPDPANELTSQSPPSYTQTSNVIEIPLLSKQSNSCSIIHDVYKSRLERRVPPTSRSTMTVRMVSPRSYPLEPSKDRGSCSVPNPLQ